MWPWRRHSRGLPPDRVETPEQLDSVLSLINPRVWVAHVILLTGVLVGLVWAFFGSVTLSRTLTGTVLPDRPPVGVIVRETGVLTELLVQGGERVRRQQPLARIQLPELYAQIADLRTRLEVLRLENARIEEFEHRAEAIRSAVEHERLTELEKQLSGLPAGPELAKPGREPQLADEIRSIRNAAALRALDLERSRFQRRMTAEGVEAQIDRLSRRAAEAGELRSPIDGTLGHVSVEAGPVESGRSIAWVFPDAVDPSVLRVRSQLSAQSAHGIEPGAPVSILLQNPAGDGLPLRLRGSVSALIPMVDDLGCILEVRADFPPSPGSTPAGPPPGATCTLRVEVDRHRPIHILFPPEGRRAR